MNPPIPKSVTGRLAELAAHSSKHGRYQPVPDFLKDIIPAPEIDEKWRSPRLQLDLVRRLRPEWSSTVVELGANLGYVSLSLAWESPETQFIAIEATPPHAEFIRTVAELFELNIAVVPEMLKPAEVLNQYPEATLLDFNVAHHFGVDLKIREIRKPEDWWQNLPSWIEPPRSTALRFLQIGYNWGGSKQTPLHDSEDPGGFARRLLEVLPGNASTYCLKGGASGLSYEIVDTANFKTAIEAAYREHNLVGEYYRRPIFVF